MTEPVSKVLSALREGDNFLITSHVNPDGDAVGAMSAMGHLFKALNKNFELFSSSEIPDRYAWLTLPKPVRTELPGFDPDNIVALDCGEKSRLSREVQEIFDQKHTINIDHHVSNPGYADINWVETGRSSVGEMIGILARELGLPLAGPMGEAIYVAIVTDTGFFSYGNTTSETMNMASEILRQGLKPGPFNARLKSYFTVNRLKLHGAVLQDVRLYHYGQISVARVSAEMMERTGTTREDTEDLVNLIRQIKGVKVAALLREDGENRVKFSLRSWSEADVNAVAEQFGGGGHKSASGGLIEDDLDRAEKNLVEVIVKQLQDPGEDDQ